jgi:TetR/AcrR family transcriptional regulator, mexJK operon transcriptional repressor
MPRSTAGPGDEHPLGRSAQKRLAILGAAREVFLAHGYVAASMDDVATLARVSKMTVYHQFTNKEKLFIAVMTEAIAQAEEGTHSLVESLATSVDLEPDLIAFARRHVIEVIQPHLLRMRRVIIAEAERFPELARTWHRAGPERGHATLARQIEALDERGLLHAPDPLLAAQHLNYLILSVPLNEAMFGAHDTSPSRRQLHHYADEGVRVFLAAYRAQ